MVRSIVAARMQPKINEKWKRKRSLFIEEDLYLGLIKIQKNESRFSNKMKMQRVKRKEMSYFCDYKILLRICT